MRFEAKSEEEVSSFDLAPAGKYAFEVLEAEEKQSKAGNDMIALKIGILHNGSMNGVFDYLVSGEKTAYKVRHFADAVGMLAEYEKGQLNAADLVGLTGECQIVIQPAKDGYDAKNSVKDYVKRGGAQPAKAAKGARTEIIQDDPIPW